MPLPQIPVAEKTITLPIANTPVLIHSWRVGDEKLLLAAAQSNNATEIQTTYVNLIQSVIQTGHNIQTFQMADVEYAFLQIRALSIDENITRRYQCHSPNSENASGHCDEIVTVQIPIASAQIEPLNATTTTFLNFDTPDHIIRVAMRMPTLADSPFIPPDPEDFEAIQPFLQRLITSITVDEAVFDPSDSTQPEWQRFFDSLQRQHLEQLQAFVQHIPHLVVRTPFECPKCGLKTELVFRGLRDLFF